MSVNVLIASYISSEERKITIRDTLRSIADNTRLPDRVLISYSVREGVANPPIDEWHTILGNICLTTFYHENRLLQFEHYEFLSHHIKDDDIIIFSDDDDILCPTKISTVIEAMNFNDVSAHKLMRFGNKFSKDFIPYETLGETPLYACMREYCCFSVKGLVLKNFISSEIFTKNLTGEWAGMLDLWFMVWLEEYQSISYIEEVLILYRGQAYPKFYNR